MRHSEGGKEGGGGEKEENEGSKGIEGKGREGAWERATR